MSQNAKLSLLAALVIGVAVLLIWCAGGSPPEAGRVHRIDQEQVSGAQQHRYDDSLQSASALRPPPRGYTQMRSGRPGADSTH